MCSHNVCCGLSMHCTVMVCVVLCARATDDTRCLLLNTAILSELHCDVAERTHSKNAACDTTRQACFEMA